MEAKTKKRTKTGVQKPQIASTMSAAMNHSITDYLLMIRDRWLIGVTLGLLAASYFVYQKLQEVPVYYSQATMKIDAKDDKVLNYQKVADTTLGTDVELNHHQSYLNSRSFLMRVANKIPEQKADSFVAAYKTLDNPNPSVASILGQGRRINRMQNTFIFIIGFEHRDPEMAAYAANLYTEEYIEFLLDNVETSNVSAMQFLGARAEDLKNRVEEGERSLQQYRKDHNMSSLEDSQNIVASRVQSLNSALTSINIEKISSGALLRDIDDAKKKGIDLSTLPAISSFGGISGLVSQRQSMLGNKELLSRKYLERHPKMIDIEQQLTNITNQLETNIQRAITQFQNQYDLLLKREASLKEALSMAEDEALKLDRMKIEYDILRNNVGLIKGNYSNLSNRLNETMVSSQLESSNISVVDPALPNRSPVRPDKKKALMMGVVIFLALFAGAPIGLEFLNNKLHSDWDVQVFLSRELLGDISLNRRLSRQELAKTVIQENDTTILENFRAIYGHINLVSTKETPKTILISSTIPSEGKSFVSSNLASVFSKHGLKTLLVDTDFRRPAVHQNFGIENENGFLKWWWSKERSETVFDESLWGDVRLGITEVETGLFVLTSGGRTKATTEIFSDPHFERFIGAAKNRFDVVLFDTPPAGIFPDAVFLADYADETIFVAKYNTVPRSKVKQALAQIDKSETEILGVIINAVTAKARKRYGYSSYYDYSYYGRYYDSDDKNDKKTKGKIRDSAKNKNSSNEEPEPAQVA